MGVLCARCGADGPSPPRRPSKFPALEAELEKWVRAAAAQKKTLTDAVLRQEARRLGDKMDLTSDKFKASSGWLENFKHRYGIRRGQYFGQGKMHKAIHAYAGEAYVNSDLRDFARESMLEDRAREDAEAAAEAAAAAAAAAAAVAAPPPTLHPSQVSLASAEYQMPAASPPSMDDGSMVYAEQAHEEPSPMAHPVWTPPVQRSPHECGPVAEVYYHHPRPVEQAPASLEEHGPTAIIDDGQKMYFKAQEPEMVKQILSVSAKEAEEAVNKVLIYLRDSYKEAGVSQGDVNVLMEIQNKIFVQATNTRLDLSPMERARNRP